MEVSKMSEQPLNVEVEAMQKLITVLRNMNESGMLDLLETVTDPDVYHRILALVMTTGTMRLVDNLDKLLDLLGELAYAMSEPAEPIGLTGLLEALGDPDVQKGLGRLVKILKALGQA